MKLMRNLPLVAAIATFTVVHCAAIAADTWLPDSAGVATGASSADPAAPLMKGLNGAIRPLVCQYNGSSLTDAVSPVAGKAAVAGAQWRCELRAECNPAVPGGAADLAVTFTLESGEAKSAGVAVAFDFSDWSTDNYILVPAQIYGGNRFRILPIGYPPYIHNENDRPLDMPITTTQIEHLNPNGSHARIELNTGNVATPMMSFFNPKAKRGFILLAGQASRFGNNGLMIEEDAGPQTTAKRMTNDPGSSSPYPYQIGWNGVPIYGFPCLISETPERLRRIGLSFDNMLVTGQGMTGLYYAINRNGEKLGDTFQGGQRPSIAMIRRSADVLYFGLRSLELMKQRGHAAMIKPEWVKSFRACANGLVKVWNDYGQFGQFIDIETGKMDINGSTAGASVGAALALASRYFNQPRFLEVAEASMKMYHERDLLHGYCGGGPAEILQAPDGESASNMVESCMALYELTGKPEWLDRAKFAASMLATWMMSYDYQFPKGSSMERAGIHAAGSIFASSQNNHSAPGYYILSGDMLLKLFRATGDRRYAEMYKDQSHNVVQYAGAPHNPLRQRSGTATERVQVSDWEGTSTGQHDPNDSNMAWETLIALSCLENPGIYLHTDDDTCLVMDHVEAKAVKRDTSGVTLSITNPTQYDASVSIFAESATQAKKPLGWGAYDKWPKTPVQAGQTTTVVVSPDGRLH